MASRPGEEKALFIGRIPLDVSPSELRERFVQYGEIKRCEVKRGGYGFVEFYDQVDADRALGENGSVFLGERITVQYAKTRKAEPGSDGCFRCGDLGHWSRNCPMKYDDHRGYGRRPPPSGRSRHNRSRSRSYSRSRGRYRHGGAGAGGGGAGGERYRRHRSYSRSRSPPRSRYRSYSRSRTPPRSRHRPRSPRPPSRTRPPRGGAATAGAGGSRPDSRSRSRSSRSRSRSRSRSSPPRQNNHLRFTNSSRGSRVTTTSSPPPPLPPLPPPDSPTSERPVPTRFSEHDEEDGSLSPTSSRHGSPLPTSQTSPSLRSTKQSNHRRPSPSSLSNSRSRTGSPRSTSRPSHRSSPLPPATSSSADVDDDEEEEEEEEDGAVRRSSRRSRASHSSHPPSRSAKTALPGVSSFDEMHSNFLQDAPPAPSTSRASRTTPSYTRVSLESSTFTDDLNRPISSLSDDDDEENEGEEENIENNGHIRSDISMDED